MRIQPGCFPVGREIHTVQTTKTNKRTNERTYEQTNERTNVGRLQSL